MCACNPFPWRAVRPLAAVAVALFLPCCVLDLVRLSRIQTCSAFCFARSAYCVRSAWPLLGCFLLGLGGLLLSALGTRCATLVFLLPSCARSCNNPCLVEPCVCLSFSGDPSRLLDPPGHLCGWAVGAFLPWELRCVLGELEGKKKDKTRPRSLRSLGSLPR